MWFWVTVNTAANVYHYVIVKQAVLAIAVKNDKSGPTIDIP